MRLVEVVNLRAPIRRKAPTGTSPEVFIIESLSLIDENLNRHEGEVLADVLRMCGKKPKYFYIRTKSELEMVAEEFSSSRYRYLHLSCHGGETEIETTLDKISYVEFSKIFENRLLKRRLFASACGTGNQMFAEIVGSRNPGMLSVAAPVGTIQFDHAVAFWSAFYVKAFSVNSKSMNTKELAAILKPLANLFGVPFHWSTFLKDRSAWQHEQIDAQPFA